MTKPYIMTREKLEGFHCAVEAAIAILGGKYKAIIVWWLTESGIMRYSDIKRKIPQATAKMLSQQLRELEADEIISRKVYPVIPPKTEYTLTALGKSAAAIVRAMDKWGRGYYAHHGVTPPCDRQGFLMRKETDVMPDLAEIFDTKTLSAWF